MKSGGFFGRVVLLGVGGLLGLSAWGGDADRPILPGWGTHYWNVNSKWYIHPPAFDFRPVDGASGYLFRVIADGRMTNVFAAASAKADLSPVWTKLPKKGLVEVVCEGTDAEGRPQGVAGQAKFWKNAPFASGTYAPAVRPYDEAAERAYAYIFALPALKCLAETGTPDFSYGLNSYPSKMNAAVINAAVQRAQAEPAQREAMLKLARAAADYLIATAEPADAPLAYFTQTYSKECQQNTAKQYQGQHMLIYPASAAASFIRLYRLCGERKYLEAAERIAATYLKLQGTDGTWFLKMWAKDGTSVTPNRLFPMPVCTLLEELYGETKNPVYRAAADRAFAFIEKGPLQDWNWEGQFEDVKPDRRYRNLTKHPAVDTAMYLVKRYPGDKAHLAQARALMDFSEDQFVAWERPCRTDSVSYPSYDDDRAVAGWTVFPTVMEQYEWYVPTDASVAKMIRGYLALYAAEKNPTDLAKARALGDAFTCAQQADGRIPTQWMGGHFTETSQDWINCMIASADALAQLAEESIVKLPPGDVCLTETRRMTVADSGKIFRGAADGSTRIVGGLAVTGWTDRGNGVWGAKLPKGADGKPVFTETLFVNGRRASRARYPDTGYFHVTSVTQDVWAASATTNRIRLALPPEAAAKVAAVPADELPWAQVIVHINWDVARYPIESLSDGMPVLYAWPMKGWNTWKPKDLYAFENLRSAFDAPGEWFYDAKAGEILYRPLAGETIREAVIPVDGLETLVAIEGAQGVAFENVTFAFSAPTAKKGPTRLRPYQAAAVVSTAAVTIDRSTNIVFRNCRFEHLGSYALWFREGVKGGGACGCEMTDLGAGGVRIGAMRQVHAKRFGQFKQTPECKPVAYVETAPWMTSHIAVEDCLIAHGGRFHPAGVGVLLTHASDSTIVHNDIFDLFYTGVSVGWVWGYAGSPSQRNTVAFNHIYGIGQAELADMGGIYTLGTSFSTSISNNVIHGIHSYSYGGWGLYNDEGSEGIVLENNLVYETDDASYHQHYGRDNILRNNILLDSKAGQVAVSRAEPHRSLTVERNIIIWTAGDAFNKYDGTKKETSKIDWKGNVWWRTDGKDIFNGTPFAAWAARVKDEGSVFTDPGFADWKKRDFTLKAGSPALKAGFKPFDPSQAGRRKH